MKKETFHVISNTHWDREWYLCHEKFLVRLVELMDRLLDIMETKPDYRFITDGQFALVEDYLNAKPENRERVAKLVSEGRLLTGPWYTQPLENIVGGEALIRNLQKGISESNKLGGAMLFSYEIDEFGHTSQLPQILAGFDIHDVMAWRGVPKNCKSYFKWESPDGTVANFFNSNAGYGEATSLPDNVEDFTEIIDGVPFEREGLVSHINRIRDLRMHVSDSSHMLWLNGIDHSWAQEDILEVCRKAEELFPDYEIRQSSLEEYSAAVTADLQSKGIVPETHKGELMYTYEPVLESTNAFHTRQKKRHYESEKLLVRQVEPLSEVASLLGHKYPAWALDRSWKYVLENHAHDSLGCSSVDEVFEQVMARYGASVSLSEQIREESLRYIMSCGNPEPSLWIFNMSEKTFSGAVRTEFDIPEGFGGEDIELQTLAGAPVNMSIISLNTNGDVRYNPRLGHPVWGKVAHFESIVDIPEVKPYSALRLKIVKKEKDTGLNNKQDFCLNTRPNILENRNLRVEINPNGTFTLTDKTNSRIYPDQMIFTDDGESGHCYIHVEPCNDRRRINSLGASAEISTIYDTPLGSAVEIKIALDVPKGITADRKHRTDETERLEITSVLSLERDSKSLGIGIKIDNKCKDHRLRVLFPSYISEASVSESGQAFDEVERSIYTPDEPDIYEKPYTTHPMQDYCAVSGNKAGLGVSARGIFEYECTDNEQHALALTLLRCNEVIDNDTFQETPEYFMHEGQNICEINHSLTLIPYDGNRENLLREVKGSLMPPVFAANRDTEVSVMPGYIRPSDTVGNSFSVVCLEGDGLEITTFKKSFDLSGLTVRVRNRTDKQVNGRLSVNLPGYKAGKVYLSNLEETGRTVIGNSNDISISVPPKKLITLIFEG